jgi:hypothetical protein
MSTIGTLVSAGAPATQVPATASSPEKERITKGGVLASRNVKVASCSRGIAATVGRTSATYSIIYQQQKDRQHQWSRQPQSTHRVAIADFCCTSHHDGKISPLLARVAGARPTPFGLLP